MTDGKQKKVTIEQTSKKLKLIMAIGYILLILGVAVDMATADRADRFVGNRSRPVEDFRGWLLVEAGFDGGTEPLVDGPFLQAAGF
jgi:hypothetical protein